MEFQQIFVTFAIILIAVVGFITVLTYNNSAYGSYNTIMNGTLIDSALQNSSDEIISATNNTILSLGVQAGNSTTIGSGSGQTTSGTSQSTLLVTRGLNTITLLPQLLIATPTIISSGASAIGIPQQYSNIAIAVFFFGFAILMAYLLIVGVRRII